MANSAVNGGWSQRTLELPNLVQTRGGVVFDPHKTRWRYREGTRYVHLNFDRFNNVEPDLITSMKMVLVWYAENTSPDHLINLFYRMCHFLEEVSGKRTQPLSTITSAELLNYRDKLHAGNAWYLATLKGFFAKWSALGVSGIAEDAVALMDQLRLAGNNKGVAVLTMDPNKGPFTPIELEGVQSALNDSYAVGDVSERDYLLVWLLSLLGQRPVQYARLKVCDVIVEQSDDKPPSYVLRVPRAKQREQNARTEFRHRIIIPQIGEPLVKYAQNVKSSFCGLLNDPDQAPLFPSDVLDEEAPKGFEFHSTADEIGRRVKIVGTSLKVYSERTGLPIRIGAIRFRRTTGTRAAEEGYSELAIAEMLDHTDTQNVRVYVEGTPKIAENISRAVAFQMAPLAQAFAGKIVQDESDAVRGDDASSRIVDPRFCAGPDEAVGNCGSHGFCGFLAPIACYTCVSFQPWLDGPHLAVYDFLEKERERLKSNGDLRLAANNDRTLLAVAQVILQCDSMRAKLGRQGSNG